MNRKIPSTLAAAAGALFLANGAAAQATFSPGADTTSGSFTPTGTGPAAQDAAPGGQPASQPASQPQPPPPPAIPIGGAVGPDGAYHYRPYVTPPAVGGGPASPADDTVHAPSATVATPAAASLTTPTSTRTSTSPAVAAPSPVARVHTAHVVVVQPAPRTVVLVQPRLARGGGPVTEVRAAPWGTRTIVVNNPTPYRPRLLLGIGAGAGGFLRRGDESSTYTGPAWTTSLGVQFHPVIGFEARYTGLWNESRALQLPGQGTQGVITNSGAVLMRLTLPTPAVRPFVHGGVGFVNSAEVGAALGGNVTTRRETTAGTFPVGGGLEFVLCPSLSLAGEFTYHFMTDVFFPDATATSRGELWTASGGFRFYL